MTLKNKELFVKDPTQSKIPNDGVAKVVRPETPLQWEVLDWELRSFVCEGEYERGLDRILDSFLANLGQAQQPAVWVSGFYGSGKSHLCRVLEYLWRDVTLPDGASARDVVRLPAEIADHFVALSMAGKRYGGLWSAAGTLGAGRSQTVRLAFLSVLFESAGLPQQYPLARFTMWARENGYLDAVTSAVEAAGRTYDREVHDLFVSPIIAKALMDVDSSLGATVKDVRQLLRDQFPARPDDITDEEMFEAVEAVLRLMSGSDERYPLTLIVLDEMQQYLGDDNAKTLAVQNIVEGVSSKFDNCVLFVATGQSAMGGTPTLQKLTDRFPIHVHLSDKDVETVVRQVILHKKPDKLKDLMTALDSASGEIDRHLGGTRIAPVADDKKDLGPDYPLLPTRRRFWELALRALDRAGKAGVLRTQLRIVHEATRDVAEKPVGHVVGGDFLYEQQAPILQQSGELLKEISESILALRDEAPNGELKARICALVFLITNIPTQMIGRGEIGLRSTAPYIADLLVQDLASDGAILRKRVPELLEELVMSGRLMRLDDEYRLQTEEGAEWERDYRSRVSTIRDDAAKLATLRHERLERAVDGALGNLSLTQGASRTPRKVRVHLGANEPSSEGTDVPVWVRDEWSVSETSVRNAAASAGEESAVVHVLLPRRDADSIKDALASHAAAMETLHTKPTPQTDEGREAQRAMRGRVAAEEDRLAALIQEVVADAIVYQGGGVEVPGTSFREAVETAARNALVRLYPKFSVADHPNWGKVVTRARDGAPDALDAVGHSGDVPAHSVCREVLASISAGGTRGAALDKRFSEPPFGWPQDAIRGAVMALLAARHIRAAQDGAHLTSPKQLEPRQIGKTTLYKEDDPPSTEQRLAVRGLLTQARIPYESGQEHVQIPALLQNLLDLASRAGGEPPLPVRPDTAHIEALQAMAGNQQFRAVADAQRDLLATLTNWQKAAQQREERTNEWGRLEALLHHARDLEEASSIAQQRNAVLSGRQLLADPNPVRPLLDAITLPLRSRIIAASDELQAHFDGAIAQLNASEEWQKVEAKAKILDRVDLRPPETIDVSSQEKLLALLNDAPLTSWREKLELMDSRVKRARAEAAKELEPAATRYVPLSATLRTPDDVTSYVTTMREDLLKRVEAGPVIV